MAVLTRTHVLILLPALLSACQVIPARTSVSEPLPPGVFAEGTPEWKGQKFARNRCSECHGVDQSANSPDPAAPTFVAIMNRQGLTEAGLKKWLNNAHNYPRKMIAEIPKEHIDDLAAYMMTLRPEETGSVD